MSYDTSMVIDTGGPEPAEVAEIGNMTSNVCGMWWLAIEGRPWTDADWGTWDTTGLAGCHGKTGAELIPVLEQAVSHIKHPDHAATYRAMTPENGWGSHFRAAEYLERILAACREHPKATLWISR